MTNELALCQDFIDAHSHEAARAVERLAPAEASALLAALPRATAVRAVDAMMSAFGAECLALLDPLAAAAILSDVRPGRAVLLLRGLDAAARAAILEQMPADDARMLRTVLTHPPGSAGAVMDSRVFAVREGQRTGEVLAALRRAAGRAHDDVFVVDDEQRLIGVIRLRDLVTARPSDVAGAAMSRSVSRVLVTATRAAVLNHPGWQTHHGLPVVDGRGVLVGTISDETRRALRDEEALGGNAGLDAVTTVFALGELYWLGLSGVLDGVIAAVRGSASAPGETTHAFR